VDTFPDSVVKMMNAGGSTVTCLPVRVDLDQAIATESESGGSWQSAIFFRLGGSESAADIRLLSKSDKPFGIGMETDIIEHENASVVVLRLQVFVQPDDPLVGEVLLTPGGAETHYEILGLLSKQDSLVWFFSDQNYRVIHQQVQPLATEWQNEFDALRAEAFKRDALIRLSGKYNAQAAFADVVSRYSLR
jgi:hypothetical protein